MRSHTAEQANVGLLESSAMDTSLSGEIPDINGYQQVRLIRSPGGRSHIYRGTRTQTGQEVIIKLMPAPKDEQEALKFRRRFNQELLVARLPANNHLLAATDHGDIPTRGSDGPRFYLVYPYIRHGSLADLLTSDRPWETWELPHITDIIAQAAEGLFHLHKSGIVHQNVNPDHFVWMPTDAVRNPLRRVHIWLIDFSTAEPEGNGTSREFEGTLNHLVSEQSDGEITPAADQFALALLAGLLLTGHEPPLLDESNSLLSTRPTQLHPQRLFEPDIDQALFKALAPHPAARFSSVIEFARALQGAVLKQIQRNLYAAPSDSSLAPSARQPANPPPLAPPVQEALSTAPSTPVALIEPVVLPPLNPPKPYEPPRPREGFQPKSASRSNVPGLSLPALPAQKWLTVKLPGALRMLAWSPAGTELACTFYHDLPQVISVKYSVETLLGFEYAHSACWSPDGRFLALSMDDEQHARAEIRFWDRTTPKERPRMLSIDQREPVRGMDWSRRGLFAIWSDHQLLVYDLSGISTLKRLPEPSYTFHLGDDMFCDQLTTLRWSPNGEWLAAGSNNGQVVCWQPHTDQRVQQQPLKKNIRSIGWSPGGKILVAAFANKQVLCWNMQTGQISQAKVPEHPRMVSISHHTGQFAIATEKALFLFAHMGAVAPTAMQPGQLFAAFSADNKLATLNQVDRTELMVWQIS